MNYVCNSCEHEVFKVGHQTRGGNIYMCTNLSCRNALKRNLHSSQYRSIFNEVEQEVFNKVFNEDLGKCAKAWVRCTLTTPKGETFIGENTCLNPQEVCPREPGEDYTKCKKICQQLGHAEEVALKKAGDSAVGAEAFVEGNTYVCRNCQETLFEAGITSFSIKEDIQ